MQLLSEADLYLPKMSDCFAAHVHTDGIPIVVRLLNHKAFQPGPFYLVAHAAHTGLVG